ncbi:MAG: efflux transporter outer membrane subunit [Planctomycetes bacterium]|nr:efflux transporter outer membrane subunit [Planctomycetota bacterium]
MRARDVGDSQRAVRRVSSARIGSVTTVSGGAVIACLAASIGINGCRVGPDYVRPRAELPESWRDAKSPVASSADENARWWREFEDPVLASLVEKALVQNLSLRQTGLRVIEARALRGIAAGEFFPQTQTAFGNASSNRKSKNSPQGLLDRSYDEYSVGLQAAWELDFWGRFRRGIESADASLDATVADYDTALVLLAADTASNYVRIRSIQEQLKFTRANVKSQQDTVELTRIRFNAGAVSELDVSTAQATLSNTQALIPELEDSLRQTKLGLCVLLGRVPSELENELGDERPVPTAPVEIALGIPGDLLRRRPDVRRAERMAAALSAQIGIAAADFYPSISITGSTGFHTSTFESPGSSPGARNILDANSFEGFVGLGISWPILNYSRVQNGVRAADARFQEAAVAYQDAVLQAAADVEAGLSSFLRSREQATFLAESVTAAQRSADLSLIQYRAGAADFLRVNQAQVDLVDRENRLVIAHASIALGAIATYRALGGGWQTREGTEFVPQETIDEMRARTDWGDILSPEYERGADLLFPRTHSSGHRDAAPEPSPRARDQEWKEQHDHPK